MNMDIFYNTNCALMRRYRKPYHFKTLIGLLIFISGIVTLIIACQTEKFKNLTGSDKASKVISVVLLFVSIALMGLSRAYDERHS